MVKKAILFFDVVSSSKMWNEYGSKMKKSLKTLDTIVKKELKNYKSFIVKTIGDAYMICFDKWLDAYEFSKNLQFYLQENQKSIAVSAKQPFKLRIGISYGEVEIENVKIQNCNMKDVFGNTVNTASRMESKVSPVGGIGIVVLSDKDIEKYIEYMIEELDNNEYKYEILSYDNECLNAKKQLFKRSSRLLNNYHYSCKSLDELKGVKKIDYCFKIHLE
jgi:hypothetical protein